MKLKTKLILRFDIDDLDEHPLLNYELKEENVKKTTMKVINVKKNKKIQDASTRLF